MGCVSKIRIEESDEEVTVGRAGALYHTYQWICVWFPSRKDISGKIEICLCTGAELLLLPRRDCFLSYWGPSGFAEPTGIYRTLCGFGIFLPFWKCAGQICLWLAVSLWAGAGFAAQDTCVQKEKKTAHASYFKIWEISCIGIFGLHWLYVFVWRVCQVSCLLQIFVSVRNAPWRIASTWGEQFAEKPNRGIVFLEIGHIDCCHDSFGEGISAFLPISVSFGGHIWMV